MLFTTHLNLFIDFAVYDQFITSFIESANSYSSFSDLSDLSVLHATTPNIKLYYPEPFIATPTFIHDDIWFVHIVIYQYWLWFIFVFIIVFFFLAFLITLRWCNIRQKPVRETRGVSRSKCGDLITATVPVSWATSIIIHESTDAIELQDGFGSTEMAVGIRAYQWGWEYYYPKDLQSSLKADSGKFFGNSLTYNFNFAKDKSFLNFKNNLIMSSTTSHSVNSFFHKNLSLTSPLMSQERSDFNLGNSALISKTSTNLITTPRIQLLSEPLILKNSPSLNFSQTLNILDHFTSNFVSFNTQLEFLTSASTRNAAFNVANFGDFLFRISNPLKLSHFTDSTLFCLPPCATRFIYSSQKFNDSGIFNNVSFTLPNKLLWAQSDWLSLDVFKEFCSIEASLSWLTSSNNMFSLQADQDFKRWSSSELFEDTIYSENSTPIINFLLDTPGATNIFLNSHLISYANNFKDITLPNLNFIFLLPEGSSTFFTNFSFNTRGVLLADLLQFFGSARYLGFNSSKLLSLAFFNNLNTICLTFNFDTSFSSVWSDLVVIFSQAPKISNLLPSCIYNSTSHSSNLQNLLLFDNFSLIDSFKNMNTYQTAFWKVFKATLEEQRSSFFLITTQMQTFYSR